MTKETYSTECQTIANERQLGEACEHLLTAALRRNDKGKRARVGDAEARAVDGAIESGSAACEV